MGKYANKSSYIVDSLEDWEWLDPAYQDSELDKFPSPNQDSEDYCYHVWKTSQGFTNSYIDCSCCGLRWEDYINGKDQIGTGND